MSYIGNEPIVSATRTITEITATAGQTVFVANGGYTVGYIDVFVNGAQLQTSDFTATNGSSITLNSGASAGDDIRLVAWGTFDVASVNGANITNGTVTPAKLATGVDYVLNGITVGRGAGAVASNTAVGASALAANTTGAYGVAVGDLALTLNTSGNFNIAVGRNSLASNTTGSSNSSVGAAALYSNTTGNYNSAFGQEALRNNTTASYNTAVGYQAGYSFVNGTNTLNVFYGIQAGYSQTSGTFNTYVGPQSGYYMTTGSKNTILGGYNGNQNGLNITTSNNHVVLSDGDGRPRLVIDNNGYTRSTSAVGDAALYPDYSCRAWVNFNGTGTVAIRGSGNVSSISDNGTGNYSINLSTAMPDGTYSINSWCSTNSAISNIPAVSCTHAYTSAPSTSQYNIYTGDSRQGNFNDMNYVYSAIFR